MRCFVTIRVAVGLLCLTLWSPLLAQEDDQESWWSQNGDFSMLIEGETAAGLSDRDRIDQKLELLLWPQIDLTLPGRTDLRALGRIRMDGYDNLEPGQPSQGEIAPVSRRLFAGDQVDLDLREFFLTTTIGRTFLTLGKQQIVWGKADGLKVLDVVNPQDFQEFILDAFDDSRIPLWAVNAEIPIGDPVLQLIWIPDRTYHKIPVPSGAYGFRSPILIPLPPPGIPAQIIQTPVVRPGRSFRIPISAPGCRCLWADGI